MPTKDTDQAVLDLLGKVDKKRKEISAASKKPNWKTNLTIGYNPESTADRIMIQTVREPQKVMDIYAFLLAKESYLSQAANELGLPIDLTYMGYSIEDWKTDLKSRAAQLSIDQKKKELETLDRRVNSIVSPEQRRTMELESLQKELGD